jgi:glycerol-3-phosphate cytidylyltransferase
MRTRAQWTYPLDPQPGVSRIALRRPVEPLDRSRTAITYGTYDLFHIGHVNLFRRIKDHYDVLVVAVSTDEFNEVKGKRSAMPFDDRVEMVRSCRYVDVVIPESTWDQKRDDIRRCGADALVMGSDWSGHFDSLRDVCDVVYLPRTEGVSSSELKSVIRTAVG